MSLLILLALPNFLVASSQAEEAAGAGERFGLEGGCQTYLTMRNNYLVLNSLSHPL